MADVKSLKGMFLAYLEDDEMLAFNRACKEGWAYRDYSGAAGLLGVARVGIRPNADARVAED